MLAPPDPGAIGPTYREYAPPPDLAPYVRCLWRIAAANARPTPNRICPDGCADIVLGGDGSIRAIGTMRTAAVVPLVGRVDLMGVRFEPGEALAFFDVPLSELTDTAVSLDTLGWAAARHLGDQLVAMPSAADRRAVIEAALRARLAGARHRATSGLLRTAVRLLERGGRGLGAVRNELGVGERMLERRFLERVGLSPKAFERIARFRRAVERIQRRPRTPYAAVALDTGYADQAHLIREFKSLAGVTPAAYTREWEAVGFVQYGSRSIT